MGTPVMLDNLILFGIAFLALLVIGMFTIAIVGTVWITLWTIQRGERARAERPGGPSPAPPAPPAATDEPEQQPK